MSHGVTCYSCLTRPAEARECELCRRAVLDASISLRGERDALRAEVEKLRRVAEAAKALPVAAWEALPNDVARKLARALAALEAK